MGPILTRFPNSESPTNNMKTSKVGTSKTYETVFGAKITIPKEMGKVRNKNSFIFHNPYEKPWIAFDAQALKNEDTPRLSGHKRSLKESLCQHSYSL